MTNKCGVASCGGLATKKGGLCPTCQLISDAAQERNIRASDDTRNAERRAVTETKDNNELSGGDVNYYLLEIKDPKRLAPYTAECEDIIEALELTFAEGNVLKALWRSANMRKHGHGKRGQDMDGIYDGDKIAYYGQRVQAQRQRKVAQHIETIKSTNGRVTGGVATVPLGVPKTFEMVANKG